MEATRAALPVAAARGVTAIHDKDGMVGALDVFREPHRRGTLTPGRLADLVVLDRDPFDDLEGAQVVATMVAGRWVAPTD